MRCPDTALEQVSENGFLAPTAIKPVTELVEITLEIYTLQSRIEKLLSSNTIYAKLYYVNERV
jgi:hypothetical protein